jgi:hypothetical protein
MFRQKRSARPLGLAAEVAIDPVASLIKAARRHPLAAGETRGNLLWEHERDPRLANAYWQQSQPVPADLSPAQQSQLIADRVREIENARAARDGGIGSTLHERVRAALARCETDSQLAAALQVLLKPHVRMAAQLAVGATNSERSRIAGRQAAENKRLDQAAFHAEVYRRWEAIAKREGKSFAAGTLAGQIIKTPKISKPLTAGQIRRIVKEYRSQK